ncbi:hypothetical protein OESDEN_16701 [Oesophagostomum dentatum]|uniref:Uncharacterized protein n=1 Tax=Oesophagostomum dentatum TaxID=61180 RepID=A0A0B1SE68_OESDE|nr:hypothetical protein OESDEN_16701 [Oesophagostomum dentatum]
MMKLFASITLLLLLLFGADLCTGIPTMHIAAYNKPERFLGSEVRRVRRDECCRVSQALNCCSFQWYWSAMPT